MIAYTPKYDLSKLKVCSCGLVPSILQKRESPHGFGGSTVEIYRDSGIEEIWVPGIDVKLKCKCGKSTGWYSRLGAAINEFNKDFQRG